MSVIDRAALVAAIEQRLEHGKNWDRFFRRCVDEACDPVLREQLLNDPDMYAALEQLVFDELTGELEAV